MTPNSLTDGTSQPLTAAGPAAPAAGRDISSISAASDYMLEIEILALSSAGGTPKVRIILEDSIDDFVTAAPVCEIQASGIVTFGSGIKKTWKRTDVQLRTGVANAKLRCTVAEIEGTMPRLQVHATFHTQSPIPNVSLPLQWFVDPIAGLDTNTGNSQSQAFATFAPVPAEFSGTALQRIAGAWTDVTAAAHHVTRWLRLDCHWNMSTYQGKSWADPNISVNTFAPTVSTVDFAQWMDCAVSMGAKSVMLTVKHQDGFCLWPTAYHVAGFAPYSVAQTAWYAAHGNPDLVLQFVTAARAKGLKVVFYFNPADRTYEVRSNSTAATNAAAYIAMIEAQLSELLTNYGSIAAIITDSWGWSPAPAAPGAIPGGALGGYAHIPYATIHDYVKALQPGCLVIENEHAHPSPHSDVELYEVPVNGMPAGGNTRLCEAWDTLYNPDWFYTGVGSAVNMSLATLRARVSPVNRLLNTSVALNAGPAVDGLINNNSMTWIQEGYNLAAGKAVSASSTYQTWSASRVTDDDFGPMWSSDVGDMNPWLEIDLGATKAIAYCLAFNRSDTGYSGYLRDLKFTVYDASHTPLYTSPTINAANVLGGGAGDYAHGPISVDHNLAAPVNGRYVRMSRTDDGTGHAGLASVEILVLPQKWNRHGV